uniref:Uncharacterized protein n=1 Tax=Peronospora matthiolae TaxID=2874970 RepID=A0AAV1T1D9_9STRA
MSVVARHRAIPVIGQPFFHASEVGTSILRRAEGECCRDEENATSGAVQADVTAFVATFRPLWTPARQKKP